MQESPVVRVWSRARESNWNEFWHLDGVLRQSGDLAAALRGLAVEQLDVWPRPPAAEDAQGELECCVKPTTTNVPQVCELVRALTGRSVQPSSEDSERTFRRRVDQRRLYLRQTFELWDESLPCFILGVDFDRGLDRWRRPRNPESWRLVDHQVDGTNIERRILPALVLQPTRLGEELLADLSRTFDSWFRGAGCNGRPALDEVLKYRGVLQRYGVDCNEVYRDGLTEGWYPIDLDLRFVRKLCVTPLPDNLGELIVSADGAPLEWFQVWFQFAALTENSD